MVEGYCVKCKAKREMSNAEEVTMKNGRKAMKGKCPKCDTGMYRITGGGAKKKRGMARGCGAATKGKGYNK